MKILAWDKFDKHATGKQMRQFQAKQQGTWFMITAVVMARGGTMTLWCILKIHVVEVMSRQQREAHNRTSPFLYLPTVIY